MGALTAEDREAVRDLMARYAWHLDHGAWDEWRALFAPDGRWGSEGDRPFVGQDALGKLAENLTKRREGAPPSRHFIVGGWLSAVAGGARLRTYVAVMLPASGEIKTVGEYDVTFVRAASGWRIRELLFVPVGAAAPAAAEERSAP